MKLHVTAPLRNMVRPADGHLISNPLDMAGITDDGRRGAMPEREIDHTATDSIGQSIPILVANKRHQSG